jgi:hypothetical protein
MTVFISLEASIISGNIVEDSVACNTIASVLRELSAIRSTYVHSLKFVDCGAHRVLGCEDNRTAGRESTLSSMISKMTSR